jgi:two-component system response regulator PilR (NtrC family)
MHAHKILVVDDEATILFAMKEFLTHGGFMVDCAAEREEAEALIANRTYSAVIADLRLMGSENGDGLDVVQAAREKSRHTRIVLLSAYTTPEIEAKARSYGADVVLRKPRPMREIGHCVASLLGGIQ